MTEREQYFWINTQEDGDVYLRVFNTADEVAEEIKSETEDVLPRFHPRFFNESPNVDLEHWPPGDLLIKGRIVVPQPVTVITEYEVE